MFYLSKLTASMLMQWSLHVWQETWNQVEIKRMKNTWKRFLLATFNPIFCQIVIGEGDKLRYRLGLLLRKHIKNQIKQYHKTKPILTWRPVEGLRGWVGFQKGRNPTRSLLCEESRLVLHDAQSYLCIHIVIFLFL